MLNNCKVFSWSNERQPGLVGVDLHMLLHTTCFLTGKQQRQTILGLWSGIFLLLLTVFCFWDEGTVSLRANDIADIVVVVVIVKVDVVDDGDGDDDEVDV